MLRIVEARRDYLKLERSETDSENLNGQYMAAHLIALELMEALHEAEKGALAYLGEVGEA